MVQSFDEKVGEKIDAAKDLLMRCTSPWGMGIYASADERYLWQLWTRDPVLVGFEAFRLMGRESFIGAHLSHLIKRQAPSGKIPILFLDSPEAFVRAKTVRSELTGRKSFMLQAYESPGGVEDLSPWTKDSELLFIIAALTYRDLLKGLPVQDAVDRAWDYLQSHHIGPDGLMRGMGWRDTRTDLGDAVELGNNCLLHQALYLMGRKDQALALTDEINRVFWDGEKYIDFIGTSDVDTLGQALGVLNDVIPPDRYPAVIAAFESLATPWGYMTGNCKPNPTTEAEKALVERMPQSLVIWPFIHDFAALALLKMGEQKLAARAFGQSTERPGFCEWHDRETGSGNGAKQQMWTAGNYLRLAHAYGYDVRA